MLSATPDLLDIDLIYSMANEEEWLKEERGN